MWRDRIEEDRKLERRKNRATALSVKRGNEKRARQRNIGIRNRRV